MGNLEHRAWDNQGRVCWTIVGDLPHKVILHPGDRLTLTFGKSQISFTLGGTTTHAIDKYLRITLCGVIVRSGKNQESVVLEEPPPAPPLTCLACIAVEPPGPEYWEWTSHAVP